METYVLEMDPDPQLVPTARMFAATIARQLGCPEESVLDVKIAVSEACTNAVQAHKGRATDETIELRAHQDGAGIVYEISDVGGGLQDAPEDASTVFRRVLEDGQDDQGMGLALIQALFPAAEFEARGKGTVVRFRVAQ